MRVAEHRTVAVIGALAADVPPGTHIMRIELKDANGRASTATIKLTVVPK